jgi:hypothetical protein
MLLAVGIWTGVLGYAGIAWGVQLWTGNSQSFAYLIGLSSDPGPFAHGKGSPANIQGAAGAFFTAGSQLAGTTP